MLNAWRGMALRLLPPTVMIGAPSMTSSLMNSARARFATFLARYHALIEAALSLGVDSVILGCTEISLLIDPANLPLPGYGSTAIHSDAAVRFALEDVLVQAA